MSKKQKTKDTDKDIDNVERLQKAYKTEKEWTYAQDLIQTINDDLELREKESLIFNGLSYSQAYEYNQRKGINYAKPRKQGDDREVSMGIVHEKIIAFAALFLKFMFKHRIKCYDEKGRLIKGMGRIYELAIDFSRNLENFSHIIGLIYWEVFTQGNAFVLEDWEVKTLEQPKAYTINEKGEKVRVTPDNMDYTYEFLEGLTYEDGKVQQFRRAVSRVLDGRQVIFGNPEIEMVQEQPRITLESELSAGDAEAIYGTLERWKSVPKEKESIDVMVGEKTTIFDASRHKDPDKTFIEHKVFDKENNRFNIFLNGVMMLPSNTPLTVFYPRGNYPLSNVPAERLRGSIYARSIPAKTKFNADFLDWSLKMLANKFEQGIDPAILTKGRYTLTRDMFRGGQVTHGVSSEDYEKADPDNKGITSSEYGFTNLLREIIESQTVNPTVSGESAQADTLGQEQMLERNQRDKLGYLLDGITLGFFDMVARRAETIESKYTIKQKETLIDGEKVPVYQNFTVNVGGVENVVEFNEKVGTEEFDTVGMRDKLFQNSYKEKKSGLATEYYLVNPKALRNKQYHLDIEVNPEPIRDIDVQLQIMWNDFANRLKFFGQMNNMEEMKKEYLELSGKEDEIFTSQMYQELEKREEQVRSGQSASQKQEAPANIE